MSVINCDVTVNITPVQFPAGKPEPACTKNQTFIFWLLIGLSYLGTKLPSLRRTQYVQLCLKIRKPSDSSLSCIRPIFSTIYLCLSCSVIYPHIATVPSVIVSGINTRAKYCCCWQRKIAFTY